MACQKPEDYRPFGINLNADIAEYGKPQCNVEYKLCEIDHVKVPKPHAFFTDYSLRGFLTEKNGVEEAGKLDSVVTTIFTRKKIKASDWEASQAEAKERLKSTLVLLKKKGFEPLYSLKFDVNTLISNVGIFKTDFFQIDRWSTAYFRKKDNHAYGASITAHVVDHSHLAFSGMKSNINFQLSIFKVREKPLQVVTLQKHYDQIKRENKDSF